MDEHFRRKRRDSMTFQEAMGEAHKIAFYPMIFQAVRSMIKFGLLPHLCENKGGTRREELERVSNLSSYAVGLMLDLAILLGIVSERDGIFSPTKLAKLLVEDRSVRISMDFMHDVCYKGAFALDKSFETGKPEGLKVFGEWGTIYQGLCHLPENVSKSWFNYDNYYSDLVFDDAVTIVLENKPNVVYDIGGNTAKFDIALFKADGVVRSKIIDLPMTLEKTKANLSSAGFVDRAEFVPMDMLDPQAKLPKGADAIWMSQFLDCFSPKDIVSILKKAKEALNPGGKVFILEPLVDLQEHGSALALVSLSLYFTCMANGCSKMYHKNEMEEFIKEAGLSVSRLHQNMGRFNHTLLECVDNKPLT
jgi:hypothetical protein